MLSFRAQIFSSGTILTCPGGFDARGGGPGQRASPQSFPGCGGLRTVL